VPSSLPLQPFHDDDEVPSSIHLQHQLESDVEDDEDESYTAEDVDVAVSTEVNSSNDDDNVLLAVIQHNKEKNEKATTQKKKLTAKSTAKSTALKSVSF
jgi:hypothetical protein